MHIHVRSRHIQITTKDQTRSRLAVFLNILIERLQETHLCWKIFAAVGDINGSQDQILNLRGDNPGFLIKVRMRKLRLLLERVFAQMQADS